jgi:DNA-binding transcriptional ArsR family regulator
MKLDEAARLLAQLGNQARLEIVRLLIKAGHDGLTVGEIQSHLDMPASTLAFHLRGLVAVGLVTQTKEGRNVRCQPSFESINAAVAFLKEECCSGIGTARRRDTGRKTA